MKHNIFRIGQSYSKKEIYTLLKVPKEKQKGAWDTGYREYEGDIYIFINVGTCGRTGHTYQNYWDGEMLHWEAKRNTNLKQSLIKKISESQTARCNHIFTRNNNRDLFQYRGNGKVHSVFDTVPVKIIWTFD